MIHMKQIIVIIFLILMSCMENGKEYDLLGKRGVIEYPEIKAHIYYQSETEIQWQITDKNGKESSGNEKVSYQRLSDELHFLNWIEKDGTTISQVINTKTGSVKTFWSFNDENSEQGGRSSLFLDGKFSVLSKKEQ